MKKFIKNLRKDIKLFNKPISRELYELAIIKHVLIRLSNICSRDDRFFLYKENISLRRKIYNKNVSLRKNVTKVSCKSLCLLVQKILKQLRIETTLYSAGLDEFKHEAIIYQYNNNKYYIDPLLDLVNLKVGANTQYFGIDYKKLQGLKILKEEEHKEINRILNFKETYTHFLSSLTKINAIYELITKAQSYCRITTVADFIIFLNKIIKDVLSPNIRDRVNITYCITLKRVKFQNNNVIKNGVEGICIKDGENINYYFPSKNQFIKTNCELKEIYTKPKYEIKLFEHIRNNNLNRQILDNMHFQKLFFELEKQFNFTEEDIEVNEENVSVKSLDVSFFIYKGRYLAMRQKNEAFYYVVKNFGYLVYKKQINNL